MSPERLKRLLEATRGGEVTVEEAMRQLAHMPFEPLGFATLDHHRALRCGFPEVIFGQGKTPEQLATIFARLAEHGGNVLATRVSQLQYAAVHARFRDAVFAESGRCITLRQTPEQQTQGTIALVAAGTSDLPVIEEARVTCEIMDQRVETMYDVGVAGIHRLLARSEALQRARVIVVAAGMEGALPSVVGGLVAAPVIAVPTSVGYGASFGGIAPLLTMLNSCATGVAVVNIDNGFAAGYLAAVINRIGEAAPDAPDA